MRKLLDIKRYTPWLRDGSYHQVFVYETEEDGATVATALRELCAREQLVDVEGNPAEPIRWDCGCLQKKCGACAMVVNGRPQAACGARLDALKGDTVYLEPLSKFPVVADLVVDRAIIFDRLREDAAWLEEEAAGRPRRSDIAFEASMCLECGCCLEVCPQFSTEGAFDGMAAMVPFARLLAQADAADRPRLSESYRKAVFAGCGKSLACRNVCPAGIDIAKLMSRSNAAALWHRY